MKYLKPRYFLFILKLFYFKARFGTGFLTRGIHYGFESGFSLRIEEGGSLDMGHWVYFTKRTDIMALGGRIEIGDHVSFNKDCTVISRNSISIGSHCQFGEMVSIYDHDHEFRQEGRPIRGQGYRTAPISIGNNVWVGGKAFIRAGVRIGDDAVIGACAVVTRDVPAGHIAVGNPARSKPIARKAAV